MSKHIGLNDPCPCGSGHKYKKCCLGKTAVKKVPGPPQLNDIDTFELVRKTSCVGKHGTQRKKWCQSYIEWKDGWFKDLADRQAAAARNLGAEISCGRGCSHCCSQYVGGSLQECEATVYWLYQHEPARLGFLERYPAWRESVRKQDQVFQRVNQLGTIAMSQPFNNEAMTAFKAAS